MAADPSSVDDRLRRHTEQLERHTEQLERHTAQLQRVEAEVRGLRTELRAPSRPAVTPTTGSAPVVATPGEGPESALEAERDVGRELVGELALVGRTLMVLGGGFLLRAITETSALDDTAGVALGLLYALVWLTLAHRTGHGTGQRTALSGTAVPAERSRSGVYHALAFTLIAFPLVVEAVLRFEVLTAGTGALVLAGLVALGLAVAVHRGLRSAAWLTSLGTVGAAWVLMLGSGGAVGYLLVLLALGVATLVLSYRLPWRVLPWLTGAALDLALLVPVVQVIYDRWSASVAVASTLLVGSLLAYLGVFVPRTLEAEWQPRPFEVAQTLALLVVAYGGALQVAVVEPGAALGLGLAGLVLALASFAGAGAFLRWRRRDRSALQYYAALGCPLLLGASELLLTGAVESVLWAALAVAVGLVAVRLGSITLALVGTLFAVAAGVVSGLLLHGVWALTMPAARPWPELTPVALVVLVATAVAAALPYPEQSEFWRGGASLPRLVLLVVVVIGVAGALLEGTAPLVAGGPGAEADAGALAALRTGVLALLAVVAAWLGRWPRLRQLAWLVYPLLAVGGLKLMVQDFLVGRPATLFAGLAVYGAALIAAPRVLRQRAAPPPDR